MTQSQIWNPKTRNRSLLIGLLLLAFALRLYRLDTQAIWVDEGISLHLATSSLAEIVADRAANIHPPLYFFSLKAWVVLTGPPVNVFSARFLSAMASLLQVAVIYAVTRRLLGRPTAWVAAVLTALSPLSVIYAQEIRVYALLPLVYLALLAVTHELIDRPDRHRRAAWLLFGIVELLGLHLHYTVLVLVAYTGGWLLLTFWQEKRWNDVRRWLMAQLLVGLASLPWLLATLAHWSSVQIEATADTTLAQPPPLGYILDQIWIFHLTGLAGALGRPDMRTLSGITFLALALLLLLRLARPSTRRPVARLLAQWLVPLGVALLVWIVRPFSHPRYVTLYAPGLTILAAYAIYPGQKNLQPATRNPLRTICNLQSAILTTSLLLLSLLGLNAYFFDPAFAKSDVRDVARYLEEVTGPDDLILVPDGDWSLPFVYQGDAPIEMPGLPDEEKMWANLARWTTRRQRVFVTSFRRGIGMDRREVIPFVLEKGGHLVASQSFEETLVRLYELDWPVEPPATSALEARFGPLKLTHAWVEEEAPADTALTLALRWRLNEFTGQRYGLAISLLDLDGWPLAGRDTLLLDGHSYPTGHWAAGQDTTTYHVLPIPPDTPPLTYTLALGLYEQTENGTRPLNLLDDGGAPQGQVLNLGTVRLKAPLGIAANPYGVTGGPPLLPQPADLADGLRLLGAALDRSTLGPGQSLFVVLRWQATRSPLPDLRPRLALVQAGQELSGVETTPALGRYPTGFWQAGETVVEHRRLLVPSTAEQGPAEVVLTVGDRRLVLGQVELSAEAHIFTPPPIAYPLDVRFSQDFGEPSRAVARLIGYDLPSQTFTAGEPVTLTLYWQALEGASAADYTVFTHVLADDGHLVGQHDGPPAGGARPTLGWVPGEIITDQHAMTFREPYAGPARVEVGLYDPAAMKRVPVEGGETFFLLPAMLTILDR